MLGLETVKLKFQTSADVKFMHQIQYDPRKPATANTIIGIYALYKYETKYVLFIYLKCQCLAAMMENSKRDATGELRKNYSIYYLLRFGDWYIFFSVFSFLISFTITYFLLINNYSPPTTNVVQDAISSYFFSTYINICFCTFVELLKVI